jgi:hypothetical protein
MAEQGTGASSLKGLFEGVAVTAVNEEQLFSTGETWNMVPKDSAIHNHDRPLNS